MNNVNLIHGDCLEKMKDIPDGSVDMILCDLPYGITSCRRDAVIPFDKLWKQYERIIKSNGAIVLFGSQPFTSLLVTSNIKYFKYEIIWEKPTASNILSANKRFMKFHENILIFYKKQPTYNPQKIKRLDKDKRNNSCKNISKSEIYGGKIINEVKSTAELKHPSSVQKFNKQVGLHPTQKPVLLLELLIKTYTNENELVLDNCMGSGSTGIACLNTNRKFIGIEKDEHYFEVAKNIIENHQPPSAVF